jgi:hypothetical protein
VPDSLTTKMVFGALAMLFVAASLSAAEGRVKPKDSALAFESNLERALELAHKGASHAIPLLLVIIPRVQPARGPTC